MRKLSFWALLLFVVSIPLETVGYVGGASVAKLAGALAAGTYVLVVAFDGRLRRWTPELALAGVYFLWAALSFYWTPVQTDTLTRIATYAELALLLWLLWQQVRLVAECRSVMIALVVGIVLGSIETLLSSHSVKNGVGRYSVGDPNDFGVTVVVGIAFTTYLLRSTVSRLARLAYFLSLPIDMLAILRTASRTAAVTLAIVLVVMFFRRSFFTTRRLAAAAVVLAALLFALPHVVSSQALARIGTTGKEATSGTLNGRTVSWKAALTVFADHPVTGVGAGAFRYSNITAQGRARVAHSAFFGTIAELGLPGLFLFLALVAASARRIAKMPALIRRPFWGVGMAWLLGAGTLTYEFKKLTWLLFGLLICMNKATDAWRWARSDADGAESLVPSTPSEDGGPVQGPRELVSSGLTP